MLIADPGESFYYCDEGGEGCDPNHAYPVQADTFVAPYAADPHVGSPCPCCARPMRMAPRGSVRVEKNTWS